MSLTKEQKMAVRNSIFEHHNPHDVLTNFSDEFKDLELNQAILEILKYKDELYHLILTNEMGE